MCLLLLDFVCLFWGFGHSFCFVVLCFGLVGVCLFCEGFLSVCLGWVFFPPHYLNILKLLAVLKYRNISN